MSSTDTSAGSCALAVGGAAPCCRPAGVRPTAASAATALACTLSGCLLGLAWQCSVGQARGSSGQWRRRRRSSVVPA